MLEESQQPSSSSLLPGHQGSFSLMSLFLFFQSAASSDAGEYTWLYFLLLKSQNLKLESNLKYDELKA